MAVAQWLGLTVFATLIGVNIYYLSTLPKSNMDEDINAAIRTISIINGSMILLLLFLSMFYVQTNPAIEKRYVFLMLHLNLFFALLAVSVSVLQKRQ